jgi:hypothetical protein
LPEIRPLWSVLSLDGHLCGSKHIAQWIDDFVTGNGKRAIIHDRLMPL